MNICKLFLIVLFIEVLGIQSRSFPYYRKFDPSYVLLNLKAYEQSEEIDIYTWAGVVYHYYGGWILTTSHHFAPFFNDTIVGTDCSDGVCDIRGAEGFSLTITFAGTEENSSKEIKLERISDNGPDQNVFFYNEWDIAFKIYLGLYENLTSLLMSNRDLVLIETGSVSFPASRVRLGVPESLQSIDNHCFAMSMSKKSGDFLWDYDPVIYIGNFWHSKRYIEEAEGSDRSKAAMQSEEFGIFILSDDATGRKQGCQDVYSGPLVCVDALERVKVVGLAKSCDMVGIHRDVMYAPMSVEGLAALEPWIEEKISQKGYNLLTMEKRPKHWLHPVHKFAIVGLLFLLALRMLYKQQA